MVERVEVMFCYFPTVFDVETGREGRESDGSGVGRGRVYLRIRGRDGRGVHGKSTVFLGIRC